MSKSRFRDFGGVIKVIMPRIDKSYIQRPKIIEEIQESFLKKKEEKNLKNIFNKKPRISYDSFLLKKGTTHLNKTNRIIKLLGLFEPNPEIEIEIKESSLHLEEIRKQNVCIDISEDLSIYSQNLLRNISKRYRNNYGKTILKPKLNFIDDSIEIRWIKDDFKLILSISDDIDDIVIYTRNKSGRYINGTVPKKEIINWVLEQFQKV